MYIIIIYAINTNYNKTVTISALFTMVGLLGVLETKHPKSVAARVFEII